MTNLSVILGKRRQGKSTLALALGLARHDTVVFWDLNDQLEGWPIVTSNARIVEDWLRDNSMSPLVVVVKPSKGPKAEQFQCLVEVLFPWEDVAFVVDESSELQGPNWIDTGLEHMVRRWNDSSSLILATHRMRDANPLVRHNATDLYFFRTDYEPDLKVIAEMHGEAIAGELAGLQRYHLLHVWSKLGGEQGSLLWTDPEVWYIPLTVEMDVKSERIA
jgi:hypothetical protein